MTEVNGALQKTIQGYQAQIKQLRDQGVAPTDQRIRTLHAKLEKALQDGLAGQKVGAAGDMVTITHNQKDGTVVDDTDSHIANDAMIEQQKKYTNKDAVREEFVTPTMTEAEFEALEKELKGLRKQQKELIKERKALSLDDPQYSAKYGKIQAKLDSIQPQIAEKQKLYDEEKVLQKGKGVSGIKRAAKQNVKNMSRVQTTQGVFMTKEEEEAAIKANPEIKGHTKVLNKNDIRNIYDLYSQAKYSLGKAQKSFEEGKITADQLKEIKDYFEPYMKMIPGKTPEGYPDLKTLDTRAVQDVLVDYSGFDHKFNLDETSDLAKELNTSKSKIKSTVKKFGFGTEGTFWKRMKDAAITAGTAGLASLLGGGAKSHENIAESWASDTQTASSTNTVSKSVTKKYNHLAASGEKFTGSVTASATAQATAIATAHAKAYAKAAAKVSPALANLAVGPIAAGISAFLLSNPKTEDAFDGAKVEAVLGDINKVKGNDNKLIMKKIMDMEFTGNEVVDKRIKAAVIEAGIGKSTTKANTAELLAAYEALKQTKAAYEAIPEDDQDPDITPPGDGGDDDPVVTPPGGDGDDDPHQPTITQVDVWDDGSGLMDADGKAVTVDGQKAGGIKGHARDWELLKKWGAPTDHNDVKAKAQFIIADETGEITVTPSIVDGKKNYDAPETITIKDNTNTKVNTYTYRKVTPEEIKAGRILPDGPALKGFDAKGNNDFDGKDVPFYIRTDVTDKSGNLSSGTVELYRLELEPHEEVIETKDDKGNITKTKIHRNGYRLEQYEGMTGSGRRSMIWEQRAKRK